MSHLLPAIGHDQAGVLFDQLGVVLQHRALDALSERANQRLARQ
jgi:hypothetical protein